MTSTLAASVRFVWWFGLCHSFSLLAEGGESNGYVGWASSRAALLWLCTTLSVESGLPTINEMYTLWRVSGNTDQVLSRFLHNAGSRTSSINEAAMKWLGWMGSAAKSALPALEKIRRFPDQRQAVDQTMQRIRTNASPES